MSVARVAPEAPMQPMPRVRGKRSLAERREARAAWSFIAPWVIGVIFITIGPMGASLYLSFTDYNLLTPPEWIGTANFERMLTDARLHTSLGVTFTYVLFGVPLQLGLALFLAIILNRGLRGLSFYRSVYYLPSLLGGSVAVAVLWRQMFGSEGLVNQMLAMVGIDGPGWISNPDTALGTIVTLHVWAFGSSMVIFLAGLRQIPEMYYEASAIDGANRWRQFVSITLPLLTPVIFFNVVLQVINAFQSFTQAFVVSGGTGGPVDSTLFFTLYLYQKGFGNLEMGYASAMAWLLLLIIAALTGVNFLVSKLWVHYDN